MTSRRFRLASIARWASITAVLVILAPGTAFATHFEISRLASEIELISGQLAEDLRYIRHYGSVRQRAVTLRREASQLADSLRRDRSNSRIRSRFKDVRRGYERLEQAFFTADRRDHIPRLYTEINLLSNVFASLSNEFYYAGVGGQSYGPVYNSPYSGNSFIGSRYSGSRYSGSRYSGSYYLGSRYSGSRHSGSRDMDSRPGRSRDYDRHDQGSRSNGHIVPSRERAIPPVFRGNSGRIVSSRQGGREGLSRGSHSVQSAPSFDHTSNVLERQGRQNTQRRELGNQARSSRSSVSPRQSSRGTNVQRGRGGVSENRRRN
ncbi:MAG: hypothetical protein JKY86_06610 [Gammaproteobacteria bacterium]|nr:hypothetical protein [Gammaproteobacteria bacterium]